MATLINIMVLWLVLLTVGMAGLFVQFYRTRQVLSDRMRQVDLHDGFNLLLQKLDRYDMHRDRELREAVELFVRRCEADPIVADRMFINITELKARLK
jgi:hypothetical protein